MHLVRNYLDHARMHEEIFRNVLKDINKNFVKEGIDLKAPLEEIFQKYSAGDRYGKWTILDFKRGPYNCHILQINKNEAIISYQNIAILSGSGQIDKYLINPDDSVIYKSTVFSWIS